MKVNKLNNILAMPGHLWYYYHPNSTLYRHAIITKLVYSSYRRIREDHWTEERALQSACYSQSARSVHIQR